MSAVHVCIGMSVCQSSNDCEVDVHETCHVGRSYPGYVSRIYGNVHLSVCDILESYYHVDGQPV